MNANLYAIIRERYPARLTETFLETEGGDRYSYQDLERQAARYAGCLAGLGLAKGDRVLCQVEKSPQALFLCLACFRAGIVCLPVNPAYRQNEVEYLLSDAEPKAVVCSPGGLDPGGLDPDGLDPDGLDPDGLEMMRGLAAKYGVPHVETLDEHGQGSLAEKAGEAPELDVVPCEPDDLAALLYTSGTTGRPKGAMITHRNLAADYLALCAYWRFTPQDTLLHALPLYHVHGLFVACLCALFGGGRILFLPKFDARAVMQRLPRATVFMGVPTYYSRLLDEKDFGRGLCGNMRLFTSGSAPLLEQTFQAFQERTGHAILERYGMTETGMNTSNPVDGPRIPGTVGLPLPGVSVRVADEQGHPLPTGQVGEIQIKGDNVIPGYWRKPEETDAAFTSDGFLKSGDLGKIGGNGYVSIVGRAKDMVITGGLNVYPKEIESLIDQMEGIAESAVIGLPHPDFGEAVAAVVVRENGRADLTEERITRTLRQELANYKVPKKIFFADALPRNAMGKVQKNILRERWGASAVWETRDSGREEG